MPCTRLEDLSNEILYEIFELIEYDHLSRAFAHLNRRLQLLLDYDHLPLQIDAPAGSQCDVLKFWNRFVAPNKHRLVSLALHERLTTSMCGIDASFHRLQSLTYHRISLQQFACILPELILLPRLVSIAAHFCNELLDLTDVYRSIFRLPHLQSCELAVKGHTLTTSLPVCDRDSPSQVTRMTINHACKLEELLMLLSYTPHLVHLTCMELTAHDQLLPTKVASTAINLISLTITLCNVSFNQLEVLIRCMCRQLRRLSMTTSHDVSYLDAVRWEGLICEHMPALRSFAFAYDEYYYHGIELSPYHSLLHQFTSAFWFNRGWFFRTTVDTDYWPPIKVTYSMHSYRHTMDDRPCYKRGDVDLAIDCLHFAAAREILVDKLFSFLQTMFVTRLTADCHKLSYEKFIQLLSSLTNVKFLTVTSLSHFNVKDAWRHAVDRRSNHNRIVSLETRSFIEDNDLDKLQFFIDLCPRARFLGVKCNYTFNLPALLRFVLARNGRRLASLCLSVPVTSEHMARQLQAIIDQEQLLTSVHTLIRTSDRISLQWNSE